MSSVRRDRRGRGTRGPELRPGPFAPLGVPRQLSRSARFDALVVDVLDDIEERWPGGLPPLDLAVEEVPNLPLHWTSDRVPLGSLVPGTTKEPPRIVLFRRPIEHRAEDRTDLAAIVLTVLADQVGELLGVPPEQLHPDYDIDG
ncbi:MAG: Possibl zinc metallo-peptidase [Nocardioidaceae bacterium]|nr:Possibl zinc metallo-peptidase [Nocardioidaceae bacterium]